MNYIFKGIGVVFKTLFKWKFLSHWGLSGIYLLWNFISDLLFGEGLQVAIYNFAYSSAGAELTIHKNVELAINTPELFNFGHFVEIMASLVILYTVGRVFVKILVGFLGSQAIGSAWVFTFLFIIPLITLASGRILEGQWFIPIWDSVVYLVKNFGAVFSASLPSWAVSTTVNSSLNTTVNTSIDTTINSSINTSSNLSSF